MGSKTTEQSDEKKPKRGNGDGSVFFWPGRGWYAAVTAPDGRRVMRKAPRQNERGAEAHLRTLLNQRDSDMLTRKSMTLGEFVEEWMTAVKRRGLKPRSLATYREKIELHVVPTLGKMRLDKIAARHIDELYEAKIEAGLSPTTLAAVHARLSNLLKLAKRRKLVTHVATDEVDPPKVRKYDARILTVAEAKALLRGIADHRHGPFWTVMLGTGCRFGETAGLGWHDVDDEDVARIRRVVNQYMADGKVILSIDPMPKTEAGKRELPLPSWAAAAVECQREHVTKMREVAGTRWRDPVDSEGNTVRLLFPNSIGGPLRENRLNELWHDALRDLKLEGEPGQASLRMHDLRHSKGTLMADEGEDLVVIQKTLGHAKSSITADLYVGRVPKAMKRAADRWGLLIDPSAPDGADEAPENTPEAVS